jgi:methionine synthase II (cobalamin-independent)
VSRNLSDVVGHRFPTTQVGSYPRPSWNTFDVRERDFRVAMRDAQFAEAYSDGVRAMIGDQIDAGIDVPTDGHLWYDRHQGFISSFLLYPAYHPRCARRSTRS